MMMICSNSGRGDEARDGVGEPQWSAARGGDAADRRKDGYDDHAEDDHGDDQDDHEAGVKKSP